ncbi:MAG: hypothetical protein NVS1B7_1540 [Candidatus Saccharimonadales bacterium]
MSDTALSINHLHKDFLLPHERKNSLKERILHFQKPKVEKLHILRDINFEVNKGEFFGVVGRNGSGKSTLLKTIGGIYQPSAGSLIVNGTLTPFIELGIGFNAELTGRENIYLNGAILGLSRKEVNRLYDEIVGFAELEKFMDQKLKNYSSGMQVRLAFSIAIQAHNDILLIDEVLAVGDAAFQRKCYEIFKNIKQSEKTVIFVSHDMGAIKEYCDRAILIEDGRIISEGDPDSVANDYIQLFNTDAATAKVSDKKKHRWGDFKATVTEVNASVTTTNVQVSYVVTANDTISNPIYGLLIKDMDSHHLFDSNTKWKKISTGTLKKGQSLKVNWTIPLVFKSGRYKITAAVAHSDGLGFFDWRDNVATFDIKREEDTAALFQPENEITIEDRT